MARIDKNKCVGCGICANICPEGIKMVNGKAEIENENAECIKNAAAACPRRAIILDEENADREDVNTDYNHNGNMGQGRGLGAGKGRGLGRGPRDGRGGGRGGGGRKR